MNEARAMAVFEAHPGIAQVFDYYGIDRTGDMLEHFAELMQCLQVYNTREVTYGGAWKTYGALGNLLRSATKVDRLMNVWWFNPDGAAAMHKDALDDAQDMINHAVFFMRLAQQGNLFGAPPERPDNVTELRRG